MPALPQHPALPQTLMRLRKVANVGKVIVTNMAVEVLQPVG